MNDTFKTVLQPAQGCITEKKSRFISFLFPVQSIEEVRRIVEEHRKKYYDARHVCWAYMLGWEREEYRFNDDGEPSGTAGKPILGQINSFELTDVLILVVRYFGGTLLGAGGLTKAYREAAREAVRNARIVEKTVDETLAIRFEYVLLNEVMRVLKQFHGVAWTQDFKESCFMKLSVRKSELHPLREALSKIYGVTFDRGAAVCG